MEHARLGLSIIANQVQAINLGLNAKNNKAGKVSYTVYLIFIALQASGPLVGLLTNKPSRVQRKDGVKVDMSITNGSWKEMKLTAQLFISKEFLLIVPLIGQGVYTEAVMFTYSSLWFSVRARALGSFLSGIVAIIAGNLLGAFLDRHKLSLKKRARWSFFTVLGLQGAWWIWATVLVTEFHRTKPTYDWDDAGFGRGFALFLLWVAGFQMNYLYLSVQMMVSVISWELIIARYFVVSHIAKTPQEVVRIAGLLRGTESGWQAISVSTLPV